MKEDKIDINGPMNEKILVAEALDARRLPKDWLVPKLEQVVAILDNRRIPLNAKEREKRTGSIPYYGATGQVGWIDDYLFDEELILLGEDGAPFMESNKPKAYIIRGKSWVNNHAHVLRALCGIPSAYIKYYLDILDYREFVTGTTRLKLNQTAMRRIPIPLAPPGERERIVAEIEKQFSRLDEAVTALRRAKANLKRYKAAVLKAAVEGKLTEQWRKAHPDVEPAEKLLERILAERRKKFEQVELGKIRTEEKKPKGNKSKIKYREPVSPDYTNLPTLPKGWSWFSSDQLFWFVTSGSRGWAKYYSNTGAIFLRIGNLDHDTIALDLKDIQRVDPPENAEGVRTRVEAKDILISITADVGMVAIVPNEFEEAYINQHISLARPVGVIESPYLGWFLASPAGQKQFRELQRGATKTGLGLDDIRSVNIPLPPLEEQREIVSQMERRVSIVDELNQELDANFRRAERLRQAILKKAFSGELIPWAKGNARVVITI